MPHSSPIRILLINKDAIARAGVKLLLESGPGLKVVAQAGEKEEALKLAGQVQLDIILLHDHSIDQTEFEFLSELLAVTSQPRIILLTAIADTQYHIESVKNGVMGIVMAQNSPNVLFMAIDKVHDGEVWLDRSLIANFISQKSIPAKVDPQSKTIARLSVREREIIALIGEGLKNQQIADQLFLSEVTVRHHLTSIFRKLNVSDRLELVIYAYRTGLAQLPE